MEYITSGDRIAVENFEIGSLYKVTFLNETEVYFMCCGIGKDFVMLMSNEPRLFSLTMLSAAEVDAIDEYTPLPPPPTNLLQYQTGEPPFTFTTTDTELFSWYIKGPAGGKTANLLNADDYYSIFKNGDSYTATTSQFNNTLIRPFTTDDIGKTFTISCNVTDNQSDRIYWIGVMGGTQTSGNAMTGTGVMKVTVTVVSENDYLKITYGNVNASVTIKNIMMNEGSTALPYEPYGYKIPISCNTTISNIYIEEALGENDILHSTETDYTIATEIGENILRIQGETQPSLMQIVYKWEFEG